MQSSRRSFLQTAIASGLAVTGASYGISPDGRSSIRSRDSVLIPDESAPREAWIATYSMDGMAEMTPEATVDTIIAHLDLIRPYRPDIICFPELFPYILGSAHLSSAAKYAEASLENVSARMAGLARELGSYLICPVYTRKNGYVYNAAVVIDRQGQLMGEYRKRHLTLEECEQGLQPGQAQPPVFETDVGKIGIQICYDIEWDDGWRELRSLGADIVFWPSAFPGGIKVAAQAWRNHYAVVSSTAKGPARIYDVDGSELASTGFWARPWAVAAINIDKVVVPTWPNMTLFPQVHRKYGRMIRIHTHHEEEWSVLENFSPDLRALDVVREFGMKTYRETLAEADHCNEQKKT